MQCNSRPRRLAAAAAVAVVTGLSACSKTSESTSTAVTVPSGPACPASVAAVADPHPLAIIASVRRNSPIVTSLPAQVCTAIANAAVGSAPITLVRLDGRPGAVGQSAAYKSTAANDQARKVELESFITGVDQAVLTIQAAAPDVDIRQALSVAADAIRGGSDAKAGRVFVIGSALQETGAPDFANRGMLDANPEEVATYIDNRHLTPDLAHITVTFVGAGTTAAPQAELDTAYSRSVQNVWHAIARHGKAASVSFLPPAGTGGPTRISAGLALPTVRTVSIPTVPSWNPNQVFYDSGPLHFKPDQTILIDPAAARIAMQPVPGWLDTHPSCKLVLTGTTARVGGRAGQFALGLGRATTIRDLIGALGGETRRIETVGLGSYFPQYTPDHDPQTGALLPDKAEINRSVRFAPECSLGAPS